jgi:electron transfer flavoprotein-quinone oxidoreductase
MNRMADDKFDVIIVGAGVAGSTAAYLLAKQGLEVVLIERGPYPGSKNLSGGVLYGKLLEQVFPNYWEEAPVERCITNNVVTFMTENAHFNLDFKTQAFQERHNAYTVLRAKFDRWLADQAENAGAMLVPGIKVDRVLKEDDRVIGIAADEEEMHADVVIAADGAFSFITQDAGLREKPASGETAIGVKELIGLPREVIEERFHLNGNEGAAYAIVGWATRGVPGGGFLYTNVDSLSIGIVAPIADLVKNKVKSGEMMEAFKHHPMIAPLVQGGRLLEYGAHIVPEGGIKAMPRLFGDGILTIGDAAGLGINSGFVVRGMDLAIGSAIAAADAVVEAKAQSDFSAQSLSAYARKLDQSSVMADMRTYWRAPRFFQNERLYSTYPELLEQVMTNIYTGDGQPKEHILPVLMKSTRASKVSVFDLIRDAVEGLRAL